MRLTQGEVQLLKSGPRGSQYPSGPTHMYEATPGERERRKDSEHCHEMYYIKRHNHVGKERTATATHVFILCQCVRVSERSLGRQAYLRFPPPSSSFFPIIK